MLPFIAAQLHKQVDQLTVDDISVAQVQLVLQDLEQTRVAAA